MSPAHLCDTCIALGNTFFWVFINGPIYGASKKSLRVIIWLYVIIKEGKPFSEKKKTEKRTKQKKREKEGFVIFVSASTSLIKWSIGEVPVVRFC